MNRKRERERTKRAKKAGKLQGKKNKCVASRYKKGKQTLLDQARDQMGSDFWVFWKCLRKMRFETRAEAREAAKWNNLITYECCHCGGYHMASRGKNEL